MASNEGPKAFLLILLCDVKHIFPCNRSHAIVWKSVRKSPASQVLGKEVGINSYHRDSWMPNIEQCKRNYIYTYIFRKILKYLQILGLAIINNLEMQAGKWILDNWTLYQYRVLGYGSSCGNLEEDLRPRSWHRRGLGLGFQGLGQILSIRRQG